MSPHLAPDGARRAEPAPEPMTARTVATLALLGCALPFNIALTLCALLRGRIFGPPAPATPSPRRTILINGGKMTKALHLARAFHRAGHRVILVEADKYRLTGHRFSRAVDRFHTVPAAGDPGYTAALVDIARREAADVYVPVSLLEFIHAQASSGRVR